MSTLAASLTLRTTAQLSNTLGLITAEGNLVDSITETITAGTFLYTDSITSDTANKTYDLIGASAGLDAFGIAVDIDVIQAIVVENTHATAFIHLSTMTANILKGTSPVVIIPPGGFFAWAYPTGVATTTNFVVTGRNAADDGNADATWSVIVVGKHA
jgi:hypothetical protein